MAKRKKTVRIGSAHKKVAQHVKAKKGARRVENGCRSPSNAKLQRLAARHKPPQAWYEESMEGLY